MGIEGMVGEVEERRGGAAPFSNPKYATVVFCI